MSATSSEAGSLYLVDKSTSKTVADLDTAASTANGIKVSATAGAPASLTTSGFADGTYVVYAVDSAGNISTVSSGITVDQTAPTSQDTVFSGAQTVQGGATVTLNSAPASGNTVWFAPTGTTSFSESSKMTKLDGDGSATDIVSPADEGTYKLYVIDAAGNVSSESSADLTVDNTAPTQAVNTAGDADGFTITITETNLDTVEVTNGDATVDTSGNVNLNSSAATGDTVEITVTDEAGNTSVETYNYDSTSAGEWAQQ